MMTPRDLHEQLLLRNNAEIDKGRTFNGAGNISINSKTPSPRRKADHIAIRRRTQRASPGEKKKKRDVVKP